MAPELSIDLDELNVSKLLKHWPLKSPYHKEKFPRGFGPQPQDLLSGKHGAGCKEKINLAIWHGFFSYS